MSRVAVDKGGRMQAVLMSFDEFDRNITPLGDNRLGVVKCREGSRKARAPGFRYMKKKEW